MSAAGMPSASARSQACSGPAPPNATSVKRAGSCPRSTEITRSARAIFAFTTSITAAAARRGSPPNGSATLRSARSARAGSSAIVPPRRCSGRRRPSTACASVTVGASPRPYAAGPGSAPALCGPTRSAPPASNQAIEPPPAPTVCKSTAGVRIGIPSIIRSVRSSSRPGQSDTSAEVPPISNVIACSCPAATAAANAPATPPAGPESTVRTACSPAPAALKLPPLDCMIRSPIAPPSAACSESDRSRRLR